MDNFTNDTNFTINFTTTTSVYHFPTEHEGYIRALRCIVALACILSIFGAGLIIFSYLAYPEIRTRARHMLLHLSIADLFIAVPNLLGVLVHFHEVAREGHDDVENLTSKQTNVCIAQAAFSVFGAQTSIFWTVAVAVYMYVIIVLQRPSLGLKVLIASCLICYLVPLVLTATLVGTDHLGYEVGATPGFCAIRGTVRTGTGTNSSFYVEKWPIVVGYDSWLYIAFVVLPILYIAIKCHVTIKVVRPSHRYATLSLHSVARTSDRKLIFVPLIFMLLRVWSLAVDMVIYYFPPDLSLDYRRSNFSIAFGILEGIGDSAQGLANGILFCAFTKIVREKLVQTLKCTSCRTWWKSRRDHYSIDSGEEEQESVENPITTSIDLETSHNKALLDLSSLPVGYSSMGKKT